MRALLLLVLTAAAPNREPARPADPPRTPRDLIVGDWLQEKIVFSGGRADFQAPTGTIHVLRITPTDMIFMVNGQPSTGDVFTSRYVLDATRSPLAFDLVSKEGNVHYKGIIALDGSRLLVATGNGSDRPADARTAAQVGHYRRLGR